MERERGAAGPGLICTGLIALTLTSAVSAYRAAAAGDLASTAFVAVSYATLLLLFRKLCVYEHLPPPPPGEADDRRRVRLRREVWALCTLLVVLFSWKVAAAMPSWSIAAVVWAMAALTTAGGYAALFRGP